MRHLALILLVTLPVTRPAWAESEDEIFSRANLHAEAGRNDEARLDYQSLLIGDRNRDEADLLRPVAPLRRRPDVLFNLGVIEANGGRLERALLYWMRARDLTNDPVIASHVDRAQRAIRDDLVQNSRAKNLQFEFERDPWFRFFQWFSPSALSWLWIGVFAATAVLFLARRLSTRETPRIVSSYAWVACLMAAVGVGVWVGAQHYTDSRWHYGVVIDGKAVVRTAPGKASTSFAIHAGQCVRLLAREGTGYRILRISDGMEGFVESSAIGEL